jgi:stress-induced-phosphoprotein 1
VEGNAAFQAKHCQEAIDIYSDAIDQEPQNHTLYSSRSCSYCALKKYRPGRATRGR